VAGVTRLRIVDRGTGEVLNEPPDGPSSEAISPGDRPIVLPSVVPPSARGRIPLEVVVAGWRFESEVEDAPIPDIRAFAHTHRKRGP